eukprot:TRINITY_DN4333_c1_g1_i1.p1 TRINITY_DN4333_c1_g1~~TRINITY_DN4333_c1_g1_i1.p1  ORF type:complete len:674 (+),score=146.36 TRINITY_DN4333_c1_g1_i1:43-2064(+)
MAKAIASATSVSIEDARQILEQAAKATEKARKAQADAKAAVKVMHDAAELRESAQQLCTNAQTQFSSFEAQWLDFKAKFDDLTKKAVERLGEVMGNGCQADGRPAEMISESRVAQTLHKSKRVVVLTGAGISAESGIPTFRGADGYWTVGSENYRPQELATWQKFNEMPEELWKWYQYRWDVCRKSKPNPGHFALVELDSMLQDGIMLVTQNIDGLHLDAGTNPDRLCEIHGRIDEMRCDERLPGSCLHDLNLNDSSNFERVKATIEKTPEPAKDEKQEQLPHCSKCGCRQRPKILWFDECYNESLYKYDTVLTAVKECDLLLIVGTQLTTGLPQRMLQTAKKTGAIIVKIDPLVDLEDPLSAGMLHLKGKSGELLPRILQELRALQAEQLPAPLIEAAAVAVPNKTLLTSTPVAKLDKSPTLAVKKSAKLAALPDVAKKSKRALTSPILEAAGAIALESKIDLTTSAAGNGISAIKLLKQAKKKPSIARASSAIKISLKNPSGHEATGPAVGFFVYGTLRPDDDTGASWTKSFNQGLSGEVATLSGASMYIDGSYPAVCLEDTRCSVRGFLLTPEDGKNAAEIMASKLAEADQIEGYPTVYDRTVVTVKTGSGESKQAYVYHKNGRIDRSQCVCIADGDWLSRSRSREADVANVSKKTNTKTNKKTLETIAE